MKKNKKTALVLSGGAALGASHIGVAQKLVEKNYQFDFFTGVSAGSIVAGLFACGKTPKEAEKILQETNLFSLAFDISANNFGIIRGKKFYNLIDELYEGKEFKDLDCPFYVGTTDFTTGERVIINSGKIADAVRSSISVPFVFEPFFHPTEKKWLVDGGLSLNLPVDIAIKRYKGEKIYAVDVAGSFPKDVDFSESKRFQKIKNLRQVIERATRIIFYNQLNFIPNDKRVEIIRPDLRDFTAWNATKSKLRKITKIGYESV